MLSERSQFQEYQIYFEGLWQTIEGSDTDKALALFEDYCGYSPKGYGKGPSGYYGYAYMNTYNRAIWEKVRQIHNLRDTYPNTLACTIPLWLVLIQQRINRKKFNPEGKLAAIFAVINKHTHLNAENFVNCPWMRKGDIFALATTHHNWADMFVKHFDEKQYNAGITFALDNGIIRPEELSECYIRNQKISQESQFFCDKMPLDMDNVHALFDLALCETNYPAALSIFAKYYNLRLRSIAYVSERPKLQHCKDLLDVITIFNKPIDTHLLLKAFDHAMLTYGEQWLEQEANPIDGVTPKFYTQLCEIKHLIQGWDEIENKCKEYFKPDYELALHFAIKRNDPVALRNILHTSKPDLTKRNFYTKRHLGDVCPRRLLQSYLREDDVARCISITPLMAAIKSTVRKYSDYEWKNDFLATIRALITYNPWCLFVKDSEGRDAMDYLKEKKAQPDQDEDVKHRIQLIINFIVDKKKTYQSLFTFFSGKNDPTSNLAGPHPGIFPNEIYGVMAEKMRRT